jgi:cell division protein FtsB
MKSPNMGKAKDILMEALETLEHERDVIEKEISKLHEGLEALTGEENIWPQDKVVRESGEDKDISAI